MTKITREEKQTIMGTKNKVKCCNKIIKKNKVINTENKQRKTTKRETRDYNKIK